MIGDKFNQFAATLEPKIIARRGQITLTVKLKGLDKIDEFFRVD